MDSPSHGKCFSIDVSAEELFPTPFNPAVTVYSPTEGSEIANSIGQADKLHAAPPTVYVMYYYVVRSSFVRGRYQLNQGGGFKTMRYTRALFVSGTVLTSRYVFAFKCNGFNELLANVRS